MDFQRQLVTYSLFLAFGFAAFLLISTWGSFSARPGYDDVNDIPEGKSYTVDQSVRINNLRPADAVCYKLGSGEDDQVNFGWVAALPGDQLSIVNGNIHVNGKAIGRGGNVTINDCAAVTIPAHHVFIVSDLHQRDSLAVGPLPAAALIGRINKFP
jgi:Signal peptidase, peptidase S26